jgi:hypothetical protein
MRQAGRVKTMLIYAAIVLVFILIAVFVISTNIPPGSRYNDANGVETNDKVPTADPNESDVEMIAKTIYGEARGEKSVMRRAAVAWVILNRVDSDDPYYPDTVREVIEQPHQFAGYSPDKPVTEENAEIARDVLERWEREKQGQEDAGRVIPKEYLFFTGDGKENYFRQEFRDTKRWDWSLENPYVN